MAKPEIESPFLAWLIPCLFIAVMISLIALATLGTNNFPFLIKVIAQIVSVGLGAVTIAGGVMLASPSVVGNRQGTALLGMLSGVVLFVAGIWVLSQFINF